MAKTIRILHADDSPSDREQVARYLESRLPSVTVTAIASARALDEALAGGPVDLVITGRRLAWADGLKVLETVREKAPSCPVIVLTRVADAPAAVEAMKAGVDEYLVWTDDRPTGLAAAVRTLLARGALAAFQDRVQKGLQQREGRFASVIRFCPSAMGIATAGEGRLIDVSEQYAALFGYRRDELIGRTVAELGLWADDAERQRIDRMLAEQGHARGIEARVRRRSGEVVETLVSIDTLELEPGGQRVLFSILADISGLKRLQEALRESESRWRSLLETAPDYILTVDRSGRILFLNRDVPGVGRDQIEGTSLTATVGEEFRPAVRQALETAAGSGELVQYEGRGDGPFAGLAWLTGRISPVRRDARIVALTVFVTDATLRHQVLQKLEDSDRQLRESQKAGQVGSWEWDISSDTVVWSDELFRIFGVEPRRTLTYEDFLRLVHPEDRDRVGAAVGRTLADGTPLAFDTRIVRGDGETRIIQTRGGVITGADGAPVRVAGIGHDITEVRRAEEALGRLAAFTESSPNPVLEFDRDGRLTWRNTAAQDIAGALDRTEKRTALQAEIAGIVGQCLDTGAPITGLETLVEGRTYTWSFVPVPAARVVHAWATDISRHLEMEQNLRESQRLEAVGRFATGISHNFSNLLTVIQNCGESVLEGLEEDSPLRPDADEIVLAARQGAALTRGIAAFSRSGEIGSRFVDLNKAIPEAVEMLRPLMPESITLHVSCGPEPAMVLLDPKDVQQIVLNLALNARDAMLRGGRIEIETALVDLGPDYAPRHIGIPPGPYVTLTVSDTGRAISDSQRSRLFEPGQEPTRSDRRSRVGLSAVRTLVRQRGGDVWVESQPEEGTAFRIFLPRIDATAGARPREEDAGTPRRPTILLVEEEERVRRVTRRMLEAGGYQVLSATGNEEASRLAEGQAGGPDLVLIDVSAPGFAGLDLAARLERMRPATKILFITADLETERLQRDIVRRGRPFLTKPFTRDELASKVRAVMGAGHAATRGEDGA